MCVLSLLVVICGASLRKSSFWLNRENKKPGFFLSFMTPATGLTGHNEVNQINSCKMFSYSGEKH